MPYGKTAAGTKPASGLEELLIFLREDLMGELEAINQYQAHIDNVDNMEVKELLAHIRDEEKEHFAEITKLISRIDVIQGQKFEQEHAEETASDAGNASEAIPTVGNLLGQK